MNSIIKNKEKDWNLIWANPDRVTGYKNWLPSVGFPETTLQIDLSKYDELKIEYLGTVYAESNDDTCYSLMYEDVEVGSSCVLFAVGVTYLGNSATINGKSPNMFVRCVVVTSNEIWFSICYGKNVTTKGNNTLATACVPLRIWAR